MRARIVACTLSVFLLAGCIYKAPLTRQPTRPVEPRLVGDWISPDGKDRLKVRRLDDTHAIVQLNDMLFNAWHSDVGATPLATLQELESPERKYAYIAWRLSADGQRLYWRGVSQRLVPADVADSAAARALVEHNISNPALLDEEKEYRRLPLSR